MIRILGKAPSEQSYESFLPRLIVERDRIRATLLAFIPLAKAKKEKKKTKGKRKSQKKTLMEILKAKGLTLQEAIAVIAEKEKEVK